MPRTLEQNDEHDAYTSGFSANKDESGEKAEHSHKMGAAVSRVRVPMTPLDEDSETSDGAEDLNPS